MEKQQKIYSNNPQFLQLNALFQFTFQKYENFQFESLSDSELYINLKQIEKIMNDCLKMGKNLTFIEDPLLFHQNVIIFFGILENCISQFITIDLNLAINKEIDQRYWHTFKLFIDYIKIHKIIQPELIIQRSQFLIKIKHIVSHNNQNQLLLNLSQDSKLRKLVSQIYSFLIQIKLTFNIGPEMGQMVAESLQYYPFCNKTYEYSVQFQKKKDDLFGIIYSQMRAIDMGSSIEWMSGVGLSTGLLGDLITYIQCTLQGEVNDNLCQKFNEYFQNLKEPGQQEAQFFIRVIMILIYAEQKSKLIKKYKIFDKNFQIIIQFIKFLTLHCENEDFLNVISLILYYYSENINLLKQLKNNEMCEAISNLKEKLNKIYINEGKKYDLDNNTLTEIILSFFFKSDIQLIAFSPIKNFFYRIKKDKQVYVQENTFLPKLHLNSRLINKIFNSLEIKVQKYSEEITEETLDSIFGDKKKDFQFEEDQERQKNQSLIVIDGMNVALRQNKNQFSSGSLKRCVDFFQSRGHQVQIFLPDYILNSQKNKRDDPRKTPDNFEIIQELIDQNLISGVPSWEYDDSYAIDYAQKKNGYILTNDRYNDNIQRYGQNDSKLENELRTWIRTHCIRLFLKLVLHSQIKNFYLVIGL